VAPDGVGRAGYDSRARQTRLFCRLIRNVGTRLHSNATNRNLVQVISAEIFFWESNPQMIS